MEMPRFLNESIQDLHAPTEISTVMADGLQTEQDDEPHLEFCDDREENAEYKPEKTRTDVMWVRILLSKSVQ